MSLTTEEEADIPIQHTHRQRVLEECSLSLIGRLLTDKPYNQRAAKNLFRSVWKLGNDLKIVDVGNAVFQFRFKLESQLQWVVDNGPWSFDDHLLLVRRWEKGMTAHNIEFSSISLWVQFWGLPFDLLNAEAARDIGQSLGRVLEIDNTAFSTEQARFLRVRVEVPLAQPLRRRGPVVSPEGDRSWVAFKYERIVGLCFACGRLGHEMRACTHPTQATGEGEMPYGDWLKAGGRRTLTENTRSSSSPLRHPPTNQGTPRTAPPSPRETQLTLSVETQKGKPREGNSDDTLAHHVRERIMDPDFNIFSQKEATAPDSDITTIIEPDLTHIFSHKEAKGSESDITIPPHKKQVPSAENTTPMHGHATFLELLPQGTLTRKWTKIPRPQQQNMDTTEPLMNASVGQKRQIEEVFETPEVSNDGDRKKSKNSGELSFLIPTTAEAGVQPRRVQ